MPGQNADFLSVDPYQRQLQVAAPSNDAEGEDDIDDVGGSKFGQFGSPEFAQSGFGSYGVGFGDRSTVQDEQIRRRGAADHTREDEWDLEELEKDGLDVNAFLRRTLAGADEDEKKRFRAALMRKKEGNAKELQRNVFKKYVQCLPKGQAYT